MKEKVLFVDDSDEERDWFVTAFKDEFKITTASNYDEVAEKLKASSFDLAVLDLYMPSGDDPIEDLEVVSQNQVNFPADKGDILRAFDNYQRAEQRFRRVLGAHNQTPDAGIEIAKSIVQNHPEIPIVFFSRKATFEDSVRCMMQEGVWQVFRKPHAKKKGAILDRLKKHAPSLVSQFRQVIKKAKIEESKRAAAQDKKLLRDTYAKLDNPDVELSQYEVLIKESLTDKDFRNTTIDRPIDYKAAKKVDWDSRYDLDINEAAMEIRIGANGSEVPATHEIRRESRKRWGFLWLLLTKDEFHIEKPMKLLKQNANAAHNMKNSIKKIFSVNFRLSVAFPDRTPYGFQKDKEYSIRWIKRAGVHEDSALYRLLVE